MSSITTTTDSGTVLLSAHYLPLRELVETCRVYKRVLVDENELWQKQTLRSRTRIIGANGLQVLSVPVQHTGGKKVLVKDVRISYAEDWVRVHKGSLYSAYNSSAFFEFFRDELFHFFDKKPVFLLDLNMSLIRFLFARLRLPEPEFASSLQEEWADLRTLNEISSVTSQLKAGSPYHQVFAERVAGSGTNIAPFVPYLSVLDTLCNQGRLP
jgi:hypothetical protein